MPSLRVPRRVSQGDCLPCTHHHFLEGRREAIGLRLGGLRHLIAALTDLPTCFRVESIVVYESSIYVAEQSIGHVVS
jgi:hypothetical protein